jgi:phosphate acetyltransferase
LAAAQLREGLAQGGLRLIAAVPHRPDLTWLRVRELGPRVLSVGDLSRRIKEVAVFAQGVPAGLRVLTEGQLVVVPGDRHDVVMAACLAALGETRLAALLLTAGAEPDPRIWELTRAACATGLPILVVDDDSYETATRVRDLDPGLPVDDLERIEGVVDSIADALDASWLESLSSSPRWRRTSGHPAPWPGAPPSSSSRTSTPAIPPTRLCNAARR